MQSKISFPTEWTRAGLTALLALALSACGGGGGGGGTSSDPQGGTDPGTGTGTGPGTTPGGTSPSGSAPAYMQGMLVGSPFSGVIDYDTAELTLASSAFAKLPRSDY